jgi:hypothetical protein
MGSYTQNQTHTNTKDQKAKGCNEIGPKKGTGRFIEISFLNDLWQENTTE